MRILKFTTIALLAGSLVQQWTGPVLKMFIKRVGIIVGLQFNSHSKHLYWADMMSLSIQSLELEVDSTK